MLSGGFVNFLKLIGPCPLSEVMTNLYKVIVQICGVFPEMPLTATKQKTIPPCPSGALLDL